MVENKLTNHSIKSFKKNNKLLKTTLSLSLWNEKFFDSLKKTLETTLNNDNLTLEEKQLLLEKNYSFLSITEKKVKKFLINPYWESEILSLFKID